MDDEMWVKFVDRYAWKPTPRSRIVYHAGSEVSVKRSVGEAAIKEGKAMAIPAKPRIYVEDKVAAKPEAQSVEKREVKHDNPPPKPAPS